METQNTGVEHRRPGDVLLALGIEGKVQIHGMRSTTKGEMQAEENEYGGNQLEDSHPLRFTSYYHTIPYQHFRAPKFRLGWAAGKFFLGAGGGHRE